MKRQWTWEQAKFLMYCVSFDDYIVKYVSKYGTSIVTRFNAFICKDIVTGKETGEVDGTFSCREWNQPDYPEPITSHKPEEFHVFRISEICINQVSIE